MDYNSYYLQQAEGNVFRGAAFQKGFGLGGAFRQFFTWFLPILKEHTLPVAQNLGKEVIKNVANIANDVINGENVEVSAKKHFSNRNQSGGAYKKKRNLKNYNQKNKKRLVDIFS